MVDPVDVRDEQYGDSVVGQTFALHFALAVPEQPIDVTSEYLAWRKRHFDPESPDSASQYQNVVRAVLANGELNVLTLMRQPKGGWNCEGEPATISGRAVAFVRIIHQDSTVFRLCAVR